MLTDRELLHVADLVQPLEFIQARKGSQYVTFSSFATRNLAQRELALNGCQSVAVKSMGSQKLHSGQYALQLISVSVIHSSKEEMLSEMKPTRPTATGDTLRKHLAADVDTSFPEIPSGFYKLLWGSEGQCRVVVHSDPPHVQEFPAGSSDLVWNFARELDEAGLVNIDGKYTRPFEADELGFYHFKLFGGKFDGDEYDVPSEELKEEERTLKANGYTRKMSKKSEGDDYELWLSSATTNLVGRTHRPVKNEKTTKFGRAMTAGYKKF